LSAENGMDIEVKKLITKYIDAGANNY